MRCAVLAAPSNVLLPPRTTKPPRPLRRAEPRQHRGHWQVERDRRAAIIAIGRRTFDGAACRHAELEVQFSREIKVLHLAPMTSIGPRDPLKNRTSQQSLCDELSALGPPGWHAELRPNSGLNHKVAVMPRNNSSGKPRPWVSRCFVCIAPRRFRITGISTPVTHLRQEAALIAHSR